MLLAAEVLAETAWDLYENPALLDEARAEFRKENRGGYVCAIPDGVVPVIAGEEI